MWAVHLQGVLLKLSLILHEQVPGQQVVVRLADHDAVQVNEPFVGSRRSRGVPFSSPPVRRLAEGQHHVIASSPYESGGTSAGATMSEIEVRRTL